MVKRNKDVRSAHPAPNGFWNSICSDHRAAAALIVIATFLAYFPALRGGFLWDDDTLLTNSDLIKAPDGLYRLWCTSEPADYWPMTNSTFWIEWRLWGMNPTGYHITNVLLHIAAALLMWTILRKLFIPGAFLAALLFAVHPVNVESVAWIAQRKNTLAMLFFLLSILWYLGDEEGRGMRGEEREEATPRKDRVVGRWYWLSLFAFVLAMLSKGSVAVLPVVLLLIVWWRTRRISISDWARAAPFFVVAVALTGVNLWFQTHGIEEPIRSASLAQRLTGAGAVVWFYLSKAVLPIDLIFVYPRWNIEPLELLWWLPLLAVVFLTAVLFWRGHYSNKNWERSLLFAWGYFCVALLPVLGFADVYFMKYSLVADHYEHLALIGVLAPAAAGWKMWRHAARGWIRAAANATVIGLLCALMLLSWRQSQMYHGIRTLWQTTIDRNPNCWLAYNNLGVELAAEDKTPAAMECFRHSLQLNPNNAEPYFNIANILVRTGDPKAAIENYQQALRIRPTYADAHSNLGATLSGLGQLPQAIAQYDKALQLKPKSASAHNNLGNALFAMKRTDEAVQQHELALQLKPDYAEAHFNLAVELASIGRLQEAIEHYQDAVRLKPDYAGAYANLAQAYAAVQRPTDAMGAAEKALELANLQGQRAFAEQIEAWLKDFRSKQGDRHNPKAPRDSVSPSQ